MCLISFITINYNGLRDTCQLIESIPDSDDVEVIVVDNASATDEATIIAQRYPRVVVVRSKQNLGFAGGNNLGIKASHGRFLFFINNDAELCGTNSEKLEALLLLAKRMEENGQVAMVCPKIRFYWELQPIQYAGYTPLSRITMRNSSIGFGEADRGQYDTAHTTPYVHGAAMMVSRQAVESAGMMPEEFFLYYEELDWSMMMRRAGYELWYDPAMTVLHKESQTTGQASPLRTYYITRNRLLFARRNIGMPLRLLTYMYLLGLVATRDLLKHLVHRRADLRRATWHGIGDFLKGCYGFRAMP